MQVSFQNNLYRKNTINFGAGKTKVYSDFDGTYMPNQFNHDVICRDKPPVDKGAFQGYFDKFKKLMDTITGKGEEKKFELNITTGRNLPEFNYYMNKIRDKGLKIPLPKSLITCNGGAEFNKTTNDDDFYTRKAQYAFNKQDVSQEKKDYIKHLSDGYDGDEVRKQLFETFSDTVVDENYRENLSELRGLIRLSSEDGKMPKNKNKEIYNELISDKHQSEDLGPTLRKMFKNALKNDADDFVKDKINNLAWRLGEVKGGKHKLKVFESPTNNTSWSYGDGMSVQDKLKEKGAPKYYLSVRDDGNMTFHLSTTDRFENIGLGIKDEDGNLNFEYGDKALRDKFKSNNIDISHLKLEDSESRLITGKKGSSITIKPYLTNNNGMTQLDKRVDVKKRVDEIIKKDLNDLIIVAGDGSNDVEMLNLFNYVDESSGTFHQNVKNPEIMKKMQQKPIVAIFIDNNKKETPHIGLGPGLDSLEEYFNSDGAKRFIHVDPNSTDPNKPKTLDEAIEIAVKSYAERNEEFKNNLSDEMKESMGIKIIKQTGEKIEEGAKALVKKKIAIISIATLGIGAGAYLINKKNKKNKEKTAHQVVNNQAANNVATRSNYQVYSSFKK